MSDVLKINGRQIPYTIRRTTRSRKLRLAVSRDGRVVLTIPRRASLFFAHRFAQQQAAWVEQQVNKFAKLPPIPTLQGSTAEYAKNKQAALALAKERLAFWNHHYGFQYYRISIRNQRSRWGSCSKLRNLNFNYKVALLPPELADYIFVHELCHTAEMNHSRRFWTLVAKTFPDYAKLRRQLKSSVL